jgi:hypothetical protein
MFKFIGAKKLFKDCCTDEYGQDFDVTNTLATASGVVGLLLVVIAFFAHWNFSLIDYSAGIAALLATVSGAQRIKPRALPPAAPLGDSTQGPVLNQGGVANIVTQAGVKQ